MRPKSLILLLKEKDDVEFSLQIIIVIDDEIVIEIVKMILFLLFFVFVLYFMSYLTRLYFLS